MKLVTKEIERKFLRHPLGSQDGKGADAQILVKYFTPWGAATWLVTEAERQENGDWLLFGWACLTLDSWETGYTLLSQIEELRGPWGLKAERDLYLTEKTIGEIIKAAA